MKSSILFLLSATLLGDAWAFNNRRGMFDDGFGQRMAMHQQQRMQWPSRRDDGFGGMLQTMNNMHRGWMRGFGCGDGGDKFSIEMDVREFAPEEVTVGISDRTVSISAEHIATPAPTTTTDSSVDMTEPTTTPPQQPIVMDMSRKMMRSYTVADNVNLDEATAKIINGRLIFEAPLVKPPVDENEQKDPNVIDIAINREM